MKSHYVSDLRPGIRVDDVFLICSKSLAEARNGSSYIRLKLGDRTGTVDAFKWDASEKIYAELPDDDFVQVLGTVKAHDGKLQIVVDSFHPCTDKVDLSDFLPSSERDAREMLEEMRRIIESVRHSHLRALIDHFMDDEKFLSRFSTAPAAQKIHHACLGGLLEHSLSVAKMCDMVSSHYRGINRDLLITGALLHDIGKVEEFCWDGAIRYSNSGHFIGHVVGGTMMVEKAAESIPGFDPLLKLLITHVILAHHGQRDFGSPKRPKCVEALILHYLEDMDAKVNAFQQAIAGGLHEDEAEFWTERHWLFDRPLFKGLPRPAAETSNDALDPSDELGVDGDPSPSA